MIIEQSFHALPETFVGSGYSRLPKNYESSMVSAFALAILGELNGRNVPNPISCLNAEHQYPVENKKLRADLFVDLSSTRAGSETLAAFGFRFDNWIEAKFFRGQWASNRAHANRGALFADLVRLAGLVPPTNTRDEQVDRSGRYLLHAYRGSWMSHLGYNPKETPKRKPKEWLKNLITPGKHSIEEWGLAKEGKTFKSSAGIFGDEFTFELTVTNWVLQATAAADVEYLLVLSRIDASRLKIGAATLSIKEDRRWSLEGNGSMADFRSALANALKGEAPTGEEEDARLEEDEAAVAPEAENAVDEGDGEVGE